MRSDRLAKLLDDELTSDEMAVKLRKLDLPVSGNKAARLQRLVSEGGPTPKILATFRAPELRRLCEYADVSSGRKPEMIRGLTAWVDGSEPSSTNDDSEPSSTNDDSGPSSKYVDMLRTIAFLGTPSSPILQAQAPGQDSQAVKVFKAVIQVVTSDIRERITVAGFQSVVAITFRGSLQFAMGPFAAFAVPLIKFVGWAGVMAGRTRTALETTNVQGTVYEVETTASGMFVARNPKPETLVGLPLILPEEFSIPVRDLVKPSKADGVRYDTLLASARQTDYLDVFANFERCGCGALDLGSDTEHAWSCPQRIGFDLDQTFGKCEVCEEYGSHSATCSVGILALGVTPWISAPTPSKDPPTAPKDAPTPSPYLFPGTLYPQTLGMCMLCGNTGWHSASCIRGMAVKCTFCGQPGSHSADCPVASLLNVNLD